MGLVGGAEDAGPDAEGGHPPQPRCKSSVEKRKGQQASSLKVLHLLKATVEGHETSTRQQSEFPRNESKVARKM